MDEKPTFPRLTLIGLFRATLYAAVCAAMVTIPDLPENLKDARLVVVFGSAGAAIGTVLCLEMAGALTGLALLLFIFFSGC